uniref:Uncharacterized protein n=1 Tax=Timspurckia oligopyrenoides TaxID=708627 RepID=A0A7S0ZAT9_9RHOD|mmetsp:Transcript_10600/g.19118  ORF Transcript_10600/g.19118 Transcript_10600/m.19118 type:complete len:403 (+) Transcript_10600:56-1264(+)
MSAPNQNVGGTLLASLAEKQKRVQLEYKKKLEKERMDRLKQKKVEQKRNEMIAKQVAKDVISKSNNTRHGQQQSRANGASNSGGNSSSKRRSSITKDATIAAQKAQMKISVGLKDEKKAEELKKMRALELKNKRKQARKMDVGWDYTDLFGDDWKAGADDPRTDRELATLRKEAERAKKENQQKELMLKAQVAQEKDRKALGQGVRGELSNRKRVSVAESIMKSENDVEKKKRMIKEQLARMKSKHASKEKSNESIERFYSSNQRRHDEQRKSKPAAVVEKRKKQQEKRYRAEVNEDDFDDSDEYDESEMDDFIDDDEEEEMFQRRELRAALAGLRGGRRSKRNRFDSSDDDDDDDDDDDGGFEARMREEARSAKIARREDLREARREEQHRLEKLRKKQKG